MPNFSKVDITVSHSATMLEKIADVLDCSVSAFSEPFAKPLDETGELLRLWLTIEDAQDRAAVLAFLRSVAATAAVQENR